MSKYLDKLHELRDTIDRLISLEMEREELQSQVDGFFKPDKDQLELDFGLKEVGVDVRKDYEPSDFEKLVKSKLNI